MLGKVKIDQVVAFFCFVFDERNKEMTLMGIEIICQDKLQTVKFGGNEEENILTNKLVLRCKFSGGSDGKASVYNVGDLGSIPGSGRFPGGGNGNPLQYSCLENPMDGGAWCPWVCKELDTTE